MMTQATEGQFTDGQFWTPQTVMMRAVQQWVLQSRDSPRTALSIDHNPDLDRMSRQRWPDIRIQEARYPNHDAQRLAAFADGQFDLVYSHQVLEHIPKPWLAGAELVRVLKPGGIGIHTTCAYNPRHGLPAFNDYYRFLPDGLAELFDGVDVLVKAGWGNRQALLYNLAIDDGHGGLGGRRFHPKLAEQNDPNHPWVTWIIFRKR
jgi:SAM-dependent methyltransferase